jgi:hypothetical protein
VSSSGGSTREAHIKEVLCRLSRGVGGPERISTRTNHGTASTSKTVHSDSCCELHQDLNHLIPPQGPGEQLLWSRDYTHAVTRTHPVSLPNPPGDVDGLRRSVNGRSRTLRQRRLLRHLQVHQLRLQAAGWLHQTPPTMPQLRQRPLRNPVRRRLRQRPLPRPQIEAPFSWSRPLRDRRRPESDRARQEPASAWFRRSCGPDDSRLVVGHPGGQTGRPDSGCWPSSPGIDCAHAGPQLC